MVPFIFATSSEFSAFTDIVLAIVGVIGVIGIIGGASAYFYKGRADALIELQAKEIVVLRDNNKLIKEQNDKLHEERKEFIEEQRRMRAEIKTLRRLITQPKQFNALAKTMAEQHSAVIDKLTDIATGLVDTAHQEDK